jgi:Cdc6-like AAA superfamily ATPase
MNRDTRYLELLEQKQPFASSSVSDPKDHIFPDVDSINKNVFQSIIDLIRMKSQNPSLPLAALVLGEAGFGKTHLINRLSRNVDSQHDFTFRVAYIQPIEDPAQTYSYLLREIVTNLFYPIQNNRPPTILHVILAEIIKKVLIKSTFKNAAFKKKVHTILQNNPVDIFYELDSKMSLWKKVENKLISNYSNMFPPVVFQVLMQLRYNDRRFAIIEWLKCNTLDADMSKLLHIKPENLSSIPAKEQASRDMIKHLSALIGICNQPLLICFDRLENLDTVDKAHSIGRMVEFLVDDAKTMLPVAFCRGDLWYNTLQSKFNSHVTQRLKSNTFELIGCNSDQALELIASRLTWAYGHSDHTYQPFDKDTLEKKFSNRLRSTRDIIQKVNNLARNMIDPKPIKPVIEQLNVQFRSYYQKVLDEFERHDPERFRIQRALRMFFEIKDFAVDNDFGDKYIDFGFSMEQPVSKKGIAIIDVQNHHRSVGASLKRGIDFLSTNPEACALYFRDERCLLPSRWKSTNEKLETFKKHGGHVLILDRNEAAQCFAITLMNYAIKEGDVSIETNADSEMQKASIDEFLHFIHESIFYEPFTLFKKIADILKLRKKVSTEGPKDPKSKNKMILTKTIECLRPQPMMMASTDNILTFLSKNDIQTHIDELMQLIKRFNDRFVIHRSKTEIIIMIKKEWMNAQP